MWARVRDVIPSPSQRLSYTLPERSPPRSSPGRVVLCQARHDAIPRPGVERNHVPRVLAQDQGTPEIFVFVLQHALLRSSPPWSFRLSWQDPGGKLLGRLHSSLNSTHCDTTLHKTRVTGLPGPLRAVFTRVRECPRPPFTQSPRPFKSRKLNEQK